MDEKTKKQIELHTAGATIQHTSPFTQLEHYTNEKNLETEFINKWCMPFYMVGINNADKFSRNFEPIRAELNVEIVKQLLGDFNWRTRIVGAYFASIMEFKTVEDIIGVHLLKSQVSYAGNGYCLTLATFNTPNGIQYLKKYLAYYLTRKDLYFDQSSAMLALKWTDKINGTNEIANYIDLYQEWSYGKYAQDLNNGFRNFEILMNNIKRIKNA